MMDVSSMYGNHHHHSSNFHNASNDINTMQSAAAAAAAAARNGYTNAYFPVTGQHTQTAYTQHMHQLSYGSFNGATPQYYHQQQQQQQQSLQHLQQQEKTQATPPLVMQQQHHQQQQQHTQQQHAPTYSHSHLFSPSAAEYGIVSSCTNGASAAGNTPQHASSHSPSESYYESDSMHSYYATAAVATVATSATNSPIATQSSTPSIPTIISSENGLSYTNLDCLYNQNPNHQAHLQQQYDYGGMLGNCLNAEEKYANVLNNNFSGTAGLLDESGLTMENSKQAASTHMWHHHHHHHQQTFDASLTSDNMNMPTIHANLTNAQTSICDEMAANHASSNCMTTRSQQVITPDGATTQSSTGVQAAQSKSPNHSSNLPTYKWMQLKRNVPKPQRK